MPCVLCSGWNKTVFASRPTTDVSSVDAHKLMIVGYWIAHKADGPVCDKHLAILNALSTSVELEKEAALAAAAEKAVPPQFKEAEAEARARIANLGKFPCPMGCGAYIAGGEVHECAVPNP
jgi:hypothetical protein